MLHHPGEPSGIALAQLIQDFGRKGLCPRPILPLQFQRQQVVAKQGAVQPPPRNQSPHGFERVHEEAFDVQAAQIVGQIKHRQRVDLLVLRQGRGKDSRGFAQGQKRRLRHAVGAKGDKRHGHALWGRQERQPWRRDFDLSAHPADGLPQQKVRRICDLGLQRVPESEGLLTEEELHGLHRIHRILWNGIKVDEGVRLCHDALGRVEEDSQALGFQGLVL
mmetsp:Transcript_9785/g.27883  ORF Transcript_9785/g.27883 Transcript_9785/m.27883 type:complete len:220 (+) Transcript_9785:979-1638(+)